MWFEQQVLHSRMNRSLFSMLLIQEVYLSLLFLLLKTISWNPFLGFIDWLLYLFHWKAVIYRSLLCVSTIGFSYLNNRFYSVEKHICSTRFEKICQAFSPHRMQHFLLTTFFGGLISHYCVYLFQCFDEGKTSFLSSFLTLENDFEHFFVLQHGCFTGFMFSLKYFICSLYLVKYTPSQECKLKQIIRQMKEIFKDSIICVLKSIHWYYLFFAFTGPTLEHMLISIGIKLSPSETYLALLYSLLNFRLLLVTFLTGLIILFNWTLYLAIFNIFVTGRYIFPIEMPIKTDTIDKSLSASLVAPEPLIMKYLAVLDLRFLSRQEPVRRKQVFAISKPGGHPYQWKAISGFCITSLKQFLNKLQEYSLKSAAKESKVDLSKGIVDKQRLFATVSAKDSPSIMENIFTYCQEWPAVAYFFEELPSTRMKKLFAPSQPLIWMTEALEFLVSASYTEDEFGVVQQTLPEIVRLLLDIKMAEEKLPIDLVGIRTHVKDPQGRYEHIHQRVSLKTSVNASLFRIAETFKNDIKGIYLPEEYHRYFQRHTKRKNT